MSCLIVVYACQSHKSTQKDQLYYVRAYSKSTQAIIDTVAIHQLAFHQKQDTLVEKQSFYFNNARHELSMYKNACPGQDGEYVLYELDTFGIVYYSSLTWMSAKRMISTSEKLNSLLEFTLFRIMQSHLKPDGFNESKKEFDPQQKVQN